jgi:DivIVA domain-containing protein
MIHRTTFISPSRGLLWDDLLMDEDDPEKRIAELERQLAEARGTVPPSPRGGWLTPEHVRNMTFARPPGGKRGYNEEEVDAFLHLVEAALRDPTGRILTAEQVHNRAFSKPPIGKRGYNENEVDAFLDLIADRLSSHQGAFPPPPIAWSPASASLEPQKPSKSWWQRVRQGGTEQY